jgi:imidazoleglycerol-phosphate dehydratase
MAKKSKVVNTKASVKKKSKRSSSIKRETTETKIKVDLLIDGSGKSTISTGIPFLDHMLILFSKHGFFDLAINATGDIDIDIHHTNEDVALTLGQAFAEALGDKRGIQRYGSFAIPMDEALVRVVLDISNRPSLFLTGLPKVLKGVTEYSFVDCEHFLQSFVQRAGINLHVTVLSGKDRHHIIEAIFKALARALDAATTCDPRLHSVPSTKGIL